MPYSNAGKNQMLNAHRGTNPTVPCTHLSLHTAIPDDVGSSEATGGSPAYARKAVTFNAPASGSMAKNASNPVFDVPAGTYKFVGQWSALTVGTFLGFGPINGGSVKGVATVEADDDTISSKAHGLANDDFVYIYQQGDAAIPAGGSATVEYRVVQATTDTFKLSLSSGGASINFTADGEFGWQRFIPDVHGVQGTITVNTATCDLNG